MTKYLALTIGPIGSTLARARKTRQFWGGSYLFSYLMKKIMACYQDRNDIKILLPYADAPMFSAKKGAGLFSDRCLIKIKAPRPKHDYYVEMRDIIAAVIQTMAADIDATDIKLPDDLADFYQTYFIETELPDNVNPILYLTEILNTMEQTPRYQRYDFQKDMDKFIDKANKGLFYSDAGIHGRRFQSIPEISTADLRTPQVAEKYDGLVQKHIHQEAKKTGEKFQKDTFIEALQNTKPFSEYFKNYHKYIAIVKADGDKISETIKKIGNHDANMTAFQKAIAHFADQSLGVIKKYGGAPVFAGGDDLLFFAPVANSQSRSCPTIFHLVKQLDDLFQGILKKTSSEHPDLQFGKPAPTLSFGVSVSFYKFPMGEALEKAEELLQRAKDSGRNAVAFSLQKHSQGRADEDFFIWHKSQQAFTDFLADDGLLGFYSSDERNRLHSVKFTLLEQQAVLSAIFSDEVNSEQRLGYFFRANFNEREHLEEREPYLSKVREFVHKTMLEHGRDAKKTMNTVQNALDFIQFVNADDKE